MQQRPILRVLDAADYGLAGLVAISPRPVRPATRGTSSNADLYNDHQLVLVAKPTLQANLATRSPVVNSIHGLFVQLLCPIKDGCVFSNRVVNFLNSLVKAQPESEVALDAYLGRKLTGLVAWWRLCRSQRGNLAVS